MRLCVLLFLAAALGVHAQKWTEYRRPPLYLDTQSERDGQRLFNEVEQLRHSLARELGLGGTDLAQAKTTLHWPLRILVTQQPGTTPTLSRNAYVMNINAREGFTIKQRAALAQLLLQQNLKRIPPALENAILYTFSTLEVKDTIVTIGDVLPAFRSNPEYALMHMLLTGPEFAGGMRVFMQNLTQGSGLEEASKNGFRKSWTELQTASKGYAQQPKWRSRQLSAAPIDPNRDFSEYRVDPPLNELLVADALLATGQASQALAAYKQISAKFPNDPMPLEGLALAHLELKQVREFTEAARRAVEADTRNARIFYELGIREQQQRDSWTQLRRALELNPLWPEAAYELAERENDPPRKLKWLEQAATNAVRNADYWKALAEEYEAQGDIKGAVPAWANARMAAASEAKRAELEAIRKEADQRRAIALQEEERRKREEAKRELERVKEAENARIRAAEARINDRLAKQSGNKPLSGPVYGWNEVNNIEESLRGRLVEVICQKNTQRLVIEDEKQQRLTLLMPNAQDVVIIAREGQPELACGLQNPAPRVRVGYRKPAKPAARKPAPSINADGILATLEYQ